MSEDTTGKNAIVPGPEKTVGQRLNPVPLIVALFTFLMGLTFIVGLVWTFLSLSEHLQDKLIDSAPTMWPLLLPAVLSVLGWVWSNLLDPIIHPKVVKP